MLRRFVVWIFSWLLSSDDVEWIVNDVAELGVRIGGRNFFLYKGRSLEYENCDYVLWRPVYKREFGEVCQPDKYLKEYLKGDWYDFGDGWKY